MNELVRYIKCLSIKQKYGQFYTDNSDYILCGLGDSFSSEKFDTVIEPFVGKGDLIKWFTHKFHTLTDSKLWDKCPRKQDRRPCELCETLLYDIDPKCDEYTVIKSDTLAIPPKYNLRSWILTNPPYLARNKCKNKSIFDKYNTNDLYKCFIQSIITCPVGGGIIIIPVGFFTSPRENDNKLRDHFCSQYKILHVNYFEEPVFSDTSTTVVAIEFIYNESPSPLIEQNVEWNCNGNKKIFTITKCTNWIIGGTIYNSKMKFPNKFKISRYVEDGKLSEHCQITGLTLIALDSGRDDGPRISLNFKKDSIYKGKNTSRTFATIVINTLELPTISLTDEQQKIVANSFNKFIEKKRSDTWSLFLPQFRESKDYARKRIPFELAYQIIGIIIEKLLNLK